MVGKVVVAAVFATTLFCLQGCGGGGDSSQTLKAPAQMPNATAATVVVATTTAAPVTWVTVKTIANDTECSNNLKSLGGNTAPSATPPLGTQRREVVGQQACSELVAADPACGQYFEYHRVNKRCSCMASGVACAVQPDGDVDRYMLTQRTASFVAANKECSNNVKDLVGNMTTSSLGCAQLVAADSKCGSFFEYHGVSKRCSCLAPHATCKEGPDGDVDRYVIKVVVRANQTKLWESATIGTLTDERSPSAAGSRRAAIGLFTGLAGTGLVFVAVTVNLARRRWMQQRQEFEELEAVE